MTIKDEFHQATFRFCSNVGGSPFALQCSPSTVLKYLAPEDMTTAEKKHVQIQNLGLRKRSVALEHARSSLPQIPQDLKEQAATTIQEDDDDDDSEQEEDEASEAATNGDGKSDLSQEPFERWQSRLFHSMQLF